MKKGTKDVRRVYFVSLFSAETEGGLAKAAIVRTGVWRYRGEKLYVTLSKLKKIVENFNRFKRAGEIPLDYEHGSAVANAAGQGRAAGWLERVEIEDKGEGKGILWGFFKLVGDGLEYVKKREYKFCSMELDEDYFHPEADETVGPYLLAVGLTNRPFVEQLPGMVLMSKRAEELLQARDGRAARGSDLPDSGSRADKKGGESMKINLTQYGGPAEASEEEAVKFFGQVHAKATASEAQAKAAVDRAEKAEGELKLSQAKSAAIETDKNRLAEDVKQLKEESATAKFTAIFNSAMTDPKGARVLKAEEASLRVMFDAYHGQNKVEEFEKYIAARPVILATRPVGIAGGGKPAETSAEAKFKAAVLLRQTEKKIGFTQAAAEIARENPELDEAYTAEQKAKAAGRSAGTEPSGEVV